MNIDCKPFLFIVDDDRSCLESYRLFAEKMELNVQTFNHARKFYDHYSAFDKNREHILITDISMPTLDGLKLIEKVKKLNPGVVFLFLSGTVDVAVDAMKIGAFDFLRKPIRFQEFELRVKRALDFTNLKNAYSELNQSIKSRNDFYGLKGVSAEMKSIFQLLEKVAKVDATVLITGESGTGKEKVAKAVHEASGRTSHPFVAVNCSAIPENLIESELFGHEKGAFTGADTKKTGLFLEADKGTIFLDEIGDMPYSLQSKILRVLQEKEIRPVGSSKVIPIDVRVLSATHQNLKQAIQEKSFREDLYYRLSVFPVELPPLRKRKADIALLADHFLKKYSQVWGKHTFKISKEALMVLNQHTWPGNIRELENTIERALILCETRELGTEHLSLQAQDCINFDSAFSSLLENIATIPSLKDFESQIIRSVLKRTNGHKEKAAQMLGIGRKTLYRKEQEYLAGDL